jgi:hypothetical protein
LPSKTFCSSFIQNRNTFCSSICFFKGDHSFYKVVVFLDFGTF